MDKETALRRFPEHRASIEANELRWHPANRTAPARPKSIVAITAAIVLVVVILFVIFGNAGNSTSTTSAPQTPIPAEAQSPPSPAESQAIEQNERESKAGDAQSHGIEHEVQQEKQNAHKFAEEMENK